MMTDFPYAIIGFDLDGTLLDTSFELTAALNHALAVEGLPSLAIDDVKPMVGLGTRHMLHMSLAKAGVADPDMENRLLPALMAHYRANIGTQSPPYPGLFNLMDHLDALQVTLAVVTNKDESVALDLLRKVGLLHRFACVIGGDPTGVRPAKPHRAPIDAMLAACGGSKGSRAAAFVGDSIFDVQAAHNAGIAAIGVSFGFLHQPVEQLGADAIIDHFDALIPALRQLSMTSRTSH